MLKKSAVTAISTTVLAITFWMALYLVHPQVPPSANETVVLVFVAFVLVSGGRMLVDHLSQKRRGT